MRKSCLNELADNLAGKAPRYKTLRARNGCVHLATVQQSAPQIE